MTGSLLRYRIAAYIVGVGLLVLVLVAMPLKYVGDDPTLVKIVGPLHGWLYLIYLVTGFDLSMRAQWKIGKIITVLLAGTIPFVSFIMERKVTREISVLRTQKTEIQLGSDNERKSDPDAVQA